MDWLTELAGALGLDPVGAAEEDDLLAAARDVAHLTERKATPVATFLLGMHVQRRLAGGASRADAMASGLAALRAALPSEGSG